MNDTLEELSTLKQENDLRIFLHEELHTKHEALKTQYEELKTKCSALSTSFNEITNTHTARQDKYLLLRYAIERFLT